jgi:predicted Ser/Thr protein kinase
MARSYEVLAMLRPNGGYIQYGEEFEGIEFVDCEPLTKAEWEAGFAKYDAWKAEQDSAKAAQKAALLDRLGITADEAKLLLA